jgi:adenine nucleotide transporter 17
MDQTPSSEVAIPPIIHGIGGSIGGAVALYLFYPLERGRIEMQQRIASHRQPRSLRENSPLNTEPEALGESWSVGSNNSFGENSALSKDQQISEIEIVQQKDSLIDCLYSLWKRHELYRGATPLALTLGASNFLFFYINEVVKRLMSQKSLSNNIRSLIASIFAGICNVLVMNPFWVANLRLVTRGDSRSNIFKELRHIARSQGTTYLWNGTAASFFLVSNPVIQFFLYDHLKGNNINLGPIKAFIDGAVAKAIATVLTYPLQLSQSILRMQHDEHEHQYTGTWDCLTKIFCKDGIEGLFTGMQAKLLQTVLTAAFTFLTYEQIVSAIHATHQSILTRRKLARTIP